jgi:ABC-2 type transport system permease protein
MSRSIVTRLLLKDLHFTRHLIIGSIVLGFGCLGLSILGPIAFYVGTVSLLCVLIILNILLVVAGVVNERKERTQLFVLSLPISMSQYMRWKLLFNSLAFFVPWLILTIAAVVVIDVSAIPNGFIPFAVIVLTYLLFYNVLLLSVTLVKESTAWHTVIIIFGNISINFVIALLMALPAVNHSLWGGEAVWNTQEIVILAVEVGLSLITLGLGFLFASRKRDFI